MKIRHIVLSGAVAVLAGFGFTSAYALYQQGDRAPASVAAGLFDAKCKTCHEPAIDRAPSREALAQRTTESVVTTLTTGSMSAMAAGLTPDMIRQVAVYVTGKPLAAPVGEGASSVAAGTQPADVKCATSPAISARPTDWNGFGKDPAASRFQRTTSINAGNVDRLKVKWAFSVAGGRVGQPTVIGDHLFFVTFAGDAFSLDAKTGCVYWRKALGAPARQSPIVERRSGAAPSGWVVYVGDNNRDFHAMDAMTGAELWKVNLLYVL